MFTNTSWIDYSFAVVALLICYYLINKIKLYLPKLRKTLSNKRKLNVDHILNETDLEDDQHQNTPFKDNKPDFFSLITNQDTGELFEQVQELTSQLKEVISAAVSKNYIKKEFIVSFQL